MFRDNMSNGGRHTPVGSSGDRKRGKTSIKKNVTEKGKLTETVQYYKLNAQKI